MLISYNNRRFNGGFRNIERDLTNYLESNWMKGEGK